MKGLSCEEIDQKRNELHAMEKTPENNNLMHELDFRSWVNSCLIYGETYHLTAEELQEYRSTISCSTLELYNIELNRALEIIEEQEERFKDAKVRFNVYTDSEGCTYNSCDWGD